jgi:LysR family transcriptional regulator for bpeEF and oprC
VDRFAVLQSFVRVAEYGSFTRAADSLQLSRALVSQQISALEASLRTRLLSRTTRRVALTGDGALYLERAQRVLAELAAADALLLRDREQPNGKLRVDVPTMFGRYLLIPALPRFTAQYPDVQLEIQLNDTVVDLAAESIDVALRAGTVRGAGLIARRVAVMQLVTCASPDYIARFGQPKEPEDLHRHRCIGLLRPGSAKQRDWTFMRGGNPMRLRPPTQLAFNVQEAVVTAGLEGSGVLQSVDAVVGRLLATGQLKQVLAEYVAPGPAISVVYARASRHSAKVRVFADFAADLMRNWMRRAVVGD